MIVDIETGNEIKEYNKPGELLVQSPSLALGYLNNQKATAETFIWRKDGRWIRTGDEVLVRKAASGNEHLVIVDRLKELIKVNVSFLASLPFVFNSLADLQFSCIHRAIKLHPRS